MPLIKFHFEMIMLFIYSYTNLFWKESLCEQKAQLNTQFPVGPVVTPSSLGIAGPVVTSGLPTGVGMPILPGADPLMIQDNFADVRGGVTYFNPTAQNFLPQRQVTKRAKAPIAIVDPSQKSDAADPSLPAESFASDSPELTAA